MDKKKMEKQAQILRAKRNSRNARRAIPVHTSGHVKLSAPLPRKPKDIEMNPPSAATIRLMKAEMLLEQRKNIQARREAKGENPIMNDALILRPEQKKGCSSCGRKRK